VNVFFFFPGNASAGEKAEQLVGQETGAIAPDETNFFINLFAQGE